MNARPRANDLEMFNLEYRKLKTLFHFQILKVHSSGGEFRGKRLGPMGRSYLPQFLLSIRVHYPQMDKAYP